MKNSNPVILLADDCPFTHRAVSKAIEKSLPASRVICADSVKTAQKAATEFPVDLFIVDETLPGGNGTDFLADMIMVNPCAGFIMMTDGPLSEQIEQAKWMNEVQFLRKPVHRARLLRLIQRMPGFSSARPSADANVGREFWSARLNEMPPEEIIRFKGERRTTMVLEFVSRGETGLAHFLNGQLTHVETGELTDSDALSRVLNWRHGYAFEIPGGVPFPGPMGSHPSSEKAGFLPATPENHRMKFPHPYSAVSNETDSMEMLARIPA